MPLRLLKRVALPQGANHNPWRLACFGYFNYAPNAQAHWRFAYSLKAPAKEEKERSLMSEASFCYQLFEEMRAADKLIKDTIASICQQHGLSPLAAFVIGDLKREEGQTFKALSKRCCIKPSNFTVLFRQLEQQGYVKREQDALDRRTSRLYLTEAGMDLANTIDKDFVIAFGGHGKNSQELQNQVFEGFSAIRALITPPSSLPTTRKEN